MSPGIWTPHGYVGHAYNPSSNPLCLRLTGSNVPREASSGMQPLAPRITTFFRTVTQELSLPSMEDLVPFVTQNYRMLPRSHALDPQDQEVMKLFELNRGTYPSQRRVYQANPPNYLAELIQWRVIGGCYPWCPNRPVSI